MFALYLDESEDNLWFFLTAVAIHDSRWREADRRILALLRKAFEGKAYSDGKPVIPERVEIKSNYIRYARTDKGIEPWSLLSREELADFVDRYYRLYDELDTTIFVVGIDLDDHRKRYKKPQEAYHYAFELFIERADWFLSPRQMNQPGHIFADEYKEMRRKVRSSFVWWKQRGTWAKSSIDNVIEAPSFIRSKESRVLSLADLASYNFFHAYRYAEPNYLYFQRIFGRLYRDPDTGEVLGYGLKIVPNNKMPGN